MRETSNNEMAASVLPLTKKQEWRQHYAAWQKSSLSKAHYCKQHCLEIANFYYWCKRFQDEKANRLLPNFIPILPATVQESKARLMALELRLPNQMQLVFQWPENRLLTLIKELSDAATLVR